MYGPASEAVTVELDTTRRVKSLEDLLDVLEVDRDAWVVKGFRGNAWEQNSVAKGRVTLLQVRAEFERSFTGQREALEQAWNEMLEDIRRHAPPYECPVIVPVQHTMGIDNPVLLEIAVCDPHFGMLAWGREVGQPYDLEIAQRDYAAAVENLLGFHRIYPVEKILFLAGNDLLHVDGPAPTGKGSNRGGATAAGTVQDIDSRLAKQFTIARRALVAAIDLARTVAPVDVMIVPGNHDTQQMYRMGEVLAAWYRNAEDVQVIFDPNKRKFYGWGANAFLFTHGEEYARQRESLPLIFATECPPELWVSSKHREIHTGHNHGRKTGRYMPTSEVSESRAIITRSLPALTPIDAWHHEEGYKHERAATALVYRKSGGLVGLHEFSLP